MCRRRPQLSGGFELHVLLFLCAHGDDDADHSLVGGDGHRVLLEHTQSGVVLKVLRHIKTATFSNGSLGVELLIEDDLSNSLLVGIVLFGSNPCDIIKVAEGERWVIVQVGVGDVGAGVQNQVVQQRVGACSLIVAEIDVINHLLALAFFIRHRHTLQEERSAAFGEAYVLAGGEDIHTIFLIELTLNASVLDIGEEALDVDVVVSQA